MKDDPVAPAAAQPMVGKTAALTLAVGLLAGFAAMLVFTLRDHHRRSAIEAVHEPRAVGDERFFPLAQKLVADQPIARFGGRELFAAETKLEEHRDSQMEKAGLDDTGAFQIYRKLDPEDAPFYFLKVANGSYVRAK